MMRRNKRIRQNKRTAFDFLFPVAAALLVLVLAVSIRNLGKYLADSSKSSRFSRNLRDSSLIMKEQEEGAGGTESKIPAAVDFDRLYEISEDAVAWIYAPGTAINYVIAQAEDNEYYLHRLLDGAYANGGTLFADCRNAAAFSDWNTIVYGHHMKDGTMFAALLNYREPGYYEEHPVMYLYTPGHRYRLELLAGCTVSLDDPVYTLPASEQDKDGIVEHVCERSSFRAAVPAEEGDKLVTLSTCSYDYDDARYVVVGRLKEEENGQSSGTYD